MVNGEGVLGCVRKKSTRNVGAARLTAPPSDVRKGYAFPRKFLTNLGGYASSSLEAKPQRKWTLPKSQRLSAHQTA
jgi:hypothetical protein